MKIEQLTRAFYTSHGPLTSDGSGRPRVITPQGDDVHDALMKDDFEMKNPAHSLFVKMVKSVMGLGENGLPEDDSKQLGVEI
jgi:hypothetical protein